MPAAANHRDGSSRWSIFARIMAAIPLNYALTALSTACLARLLPMQPDQASITATLASFATFAILALVAFGVRSIRQFWVVMTALALLLGTILWISIITGGRL